MWDEMSYRKYTKTASDTLPEVWDEKYNPSEEVWCRWIYEGSNDVFNISQGQEGE